MLNFRETTHHRQFSLATCCAHATLFRISIGWFTPTHCMPHACLRDPIYDATAHCILGQDDLHLVSLYFRMFFKPGPAVCSFDPALKLGPNVFFKTSVTVIRWPLLRRKILSIASSFFLGGGLYCISTYQNIAKHLSQPNIINTAHAYLQSIVLSLCSII